MSLESQLDATVELGCRDDNNLDKTTFVINCNDNPVSTDIIDSQHFNKHGLLNILRSHRAEIPNL